MGVGTVCVGGGGGCSKGTNASSRGPSSSFDKASTMSSSLTGAIGGSLDGKGLDEEGPRRVKVGIVTSIADWAGAEVMIRGGVSSCWIGLRAIREKGSCGLLGIPEKASLK